MTGLPPAFAAKTIQSTCTVWIGATNTRGYGVLQINGTVHLAHRVAYEAVHGPIPDGLPLDHLCRVRNCVRVDHLEPVTHAENIRRGRLAATLTVGDECSNGHLIASAGDLYVRGNGKVECQRCRQAGARRAGGRRRPTNQRRAEKVRAALALAGT